MMYEKDCERHKMMWEVGGERWEMGGMSYDKIPRKSVHVFCSLCST